MKANKARGLFCISSIGAKRQGKHGRWPGEGCCCWIRKEVIGKLAGFDGCGLRNEIKKKSRSLLGHCCIVVDLRNPGHEEAEEKCGEIYSAHGKLQWLLLNNGLCYILFHPCRTTEHNLQVHRLGRGVTCFQEGIIS